MLDHRAVSSRAGFMIMNLADKVFQQARHADPLPAVPSHQQEKVAIAFELPGVFLCRFPYESPFPVN